MKQSLMLKQQIQIKALEKRLSEVGKAATDLFAENESNKKLVESLVAENDSLAQRIIKNSNDYSSQK